MENKQTVLVVGTGTIGEPLIGLLSNLKHDLGIDEVLFHKRTPLQYEVAKVNSLVDKGAKLVVDEKRLQEFQDLGHAPSTTMSSALSASSVVIDCTPAGNVNKSTLYTNTGPGKLYIAQGSEKGFGVPYAWGLNDKALTTKKHDFIQVVSCNTHAIGRLIYTLTNGDLSHLKSSDFVCIRRANDASQDAGFIPSPTCGKHTDLEFGTHHARDVNDLFETVSKNTMPIFSSAVKVNSQYMHMVRFNVEVKGNLKSSDIISRLENDQFVTLTHHSSTNRIFSFGRDHGFYGRIYNQAVVSLPSLSVSSNGNITRVVGYAMTPQDGNSLLSSIAATMYGLKGNDYLNHIAPIQKYLINEV